MEGTHALGEFVVETDPAADVLRWSFFRGLRSSKLLSPEDVDLLERETGAARLDDVKKMLLDQGILTPYQLKRVVDGKAEGMVIGQYRILDVLGGGGFGQVFKANHAILDRVVALKLMTSEYCRSRLLSDVFRREIAAVRRLNHPNIAGTLDANTIDDMLFITMEFVEGTTLERFVRDNKDSGLAQACSVMLQISRGLQHAHEMGVIHRDLKPENILVTRLTNPRGSDDGADLSVKVIDFGLARLQPVNDVPTGTLLVDAGAIVGTPAFMAPEQARDPHAADCRSDLYSLGCTFYYLLTGRLPFEGATIRVTLQMHSEETAKPIRELRPEIPPGLALIVHRLMAKKPEDRYQSTTEVIDALSEVVWSGVLSDDQRPVLQATPPPRTGARLIMRDEPLVIDVPDAVVALAPPDAEPTPAAPPVAIEPMPRPSTPADAAELRLLWTDWRTVVEARVANESPPISAEGYKVLYRSLLAAVSSARTSSPIPVEALDRIYAAVEPWVSLVALARLDRQTLTELCRICRVIDALLKPPPAARAGVLVTLAAVLCGIAIIAGAWFVARRPELTPRVIDFLKAQPFATAIPVFALAFVVALYRGWGVPPSRGRERVKSGSC